jgi:hypothetical protein
MAAVDTVRPRKRQHDDLDHTVQDENGRIGNLIALGVDTDEIERSRPVVEQGVRGRGGATPSPFKLTAEKERILLMAPRRRTIRATHKLQRVIAMHPKRGFDVSDMF